MTKNKSGNLTLSVSDNAGKMREFAGSMNDNLNSVVMGAVMRTLWKPEAYSDDDKKTVERAAASQMAGFAPQDEIEGMIAAQAVGLHAAIMESLRRGMIPEQSLEGRAMNLNAANKLACTYTRLIEVLDKRRGKGQQKVVVEHVHVHSGGQAIVGSIQSGGGVNDAIDGQPFGATITAPALLPALRGQDATRDPVPVASNAKRKVPATRRPKPRRAKR